mgnify:CR=1 FL=1
MASTTKGIVYPTSGDNIAPLETHFASLAQSVDDAIVVVDDVVADIDTDLQAFKASSGKIPQTGSFAFTGPSSSATPVNLTITLPSGYFDSAPVVVATVSGTNSSNAYFPVLHSITSSQFQVRVWTTNATVAQSLTLQWIAK